MHSRRPKRDWVAARTKVEEEGVCRACRRSHDLQAAHVVPRSRLSAGLGAENPRNIIPLCGRCHELQHAGKLEILGLLTLEEQGYVASLVGIEEARRRTTRRAA